MQVLLLAVLATVNLAVSTTGDLDWSDHYANAKSQAAAEQRPLLVVLENPGDPSGKFEQAQLALGGENAELLKNYRLCRMDVTTEYGRRVADAFGAKTFPFTAITDKSAKFVNFRSGGTMSGDRWAQALEQWKQGEPVQTVAVAQPSGEAAYQRVEASKVITPWPAYSFPASKASNSYCPNCVRNQQYNR